MRKFPSWLSPLTALLILTGFTLPNAMASKRPNVLILMGDDHAAHVYGAYGNPKAETPNLDRLARSGVRFTRAYVNSPMCTPSRQSLLTGRLPHSVGVTELRTPLGDEPVTMAELLKDQGYATAAIGKMHFNSDRKHGFDLLLDNPQHREYLKANPPRPVQGDIDVLPVWRPFQDHARVWLNGMYVPYAAYDKDMAGTWFAEKAAEFLKEEREEPFFLIASFHEPHSPFRFPIEFADRFDPSTFEVPQVGPEDDWQIPEIFRDLSNEEKQRITAAYYTSTAYMDKNAGIVLDALEESGHADDTFVIYLGDHGYNLGHHGRFEKHCFYEQAVRAPLVMRLPGTTGKDVEAEALTEFIDIFPTVAEVCGADSPREVEGNSLLPILKGEKEINREFVFSEYTDNEEAMIRTERHKYIYTSGKRLRGDGYETGLPLPGRTRILFDLVKDPQEMCNRASDPEYSEIVAQLESEMLERIEKTYSADLGAPPAELSGADLLDWYLVPRDKKD